MLNLDEIRAHFPALASDTIYFDNPGGTQIAREAIQRIDQYLRATNANHGGAFRTSRESDATVAEARQAVADFLNAARPEEIVFGPNMTTLTLSISRRECRPLATHSRRAGLYGALGRYSRGRLYAGPGGHGAANHGAHENSGCRLCLKRCGHYQ